MIFVIPKRSISQATSVLKRAGEKPWIIGEVEPQRRGKGRVRYV
jgi:phosphoribosylaminoimidazole (AIR) synthetase